MNNPIRIGHSIDIHRLITGDHITLGGVDIPCDFRTVAHSDGDALVHAIGESILGALALGDLGAHFPDTDPQYLNISSLVLLEKIIAMMEDKHYHIGNIDALILIEKPKMAPHIPLMREKLATVCHTDIDRISIKATRGEGLGFVGESKGVVADATVLLYEEGTV